MRNLLLLLLVVCCGCDCRHKCEVTQYDLVYIEAKAERALDETRRINHRLDDLCITQSPTLEQIVLTENNHLKCVKCDNCGKYVGWIPKKTNLEQNIKAPYHSLIYDSTSIVQYGHGRTSCVCPLCKTIFGYAEQFWWPCPKNLKNQHHFPCNHKITEICSDCGMWSCQDSSVH